METKYFDRISEGYKGELGTEVMEQARKRIDWICAKSQGETILDIGCSQGIISILLGRRGKKVLGIDSEISRIQYAEKELEEDPELKETVRFLCDDFLNCKFEEKFDCIIMGEFLEHVFDPILFLDKAMSLLKENGRLIVTVPFGINPFPDHKRTYYFTELFYQINERICVNDVCFFGGWIGFAADKKIQGNSIDINRDLVRKLENSFFYVENRKQIRIDQLASQYDEIKVKLAAANQQVEQLKKKASELDEKTEAVSELASKLQKVSWEAERYKNESASKEAVLSIMNQELETARTYIKDLNKDKEEKDVKLAGLYEELERAEKRLRLMAKELSDVRTALEVQKAAAILTDEDTENTETTETTDVLNEKLEEAFASIEKLTEELRVTKAGIETRNRKLKASEEKFEKQTQQKKRLIQEKEELQKRFNEYNTLLYQARKQNAAYERFPSIKLYNWARQLKKREDTIASQGDHADADLPVQNLSTIEEQSDQSQTNQKQSDLEIKYDMLFSDFIVAGALEVKERKSFELRPECKTLKELKAACIMDDFTFSCFSPECNLLQLTPDNWKEELEQFQPDLLFVESAWNGNKGLWYGMVVKTAPQFCALTEYCHENRIPVIFWNKEDPGHNEAFMAAAGLCDVVFTTEVDCIAQYKRSLGHDSVYLLHFAAQPVLHNPIETMERKDCFCFAGAYYTNYPERRKCFENLAHYAMRTKGLDIYDRNYNAPESDHQFPEYYKPFILGSLEPDEIDKAYKGYAYNINANSGTWTQTMFARRVFELLASNTVSVGNFSRGLRNLLGELTIATDSVDEAANYLNAYCSDEMEMHRYRLQGHRRVTQEHLYEDRLDYIVQKVFGVSLKRELPHVTVLSKVQNEDQLNKVRMMFQNQSYEPISLHIEPLYDCQADGKDILPGKLNLEQFIKEHIADGFVAYFDPQDYYGENYLLDLMLMLRYGEYDAIGKSSYYNGIRGFMLDEPVYHFVSALNARRAVFSSKVAQCLDYNSDGIICGEDLNLVSVHEFDYVEACSEMPEETDSYISIADAGILYRDLEREAEEIRINPADRGYLIELSRFFKADTYGGKVELSDNERGIEIRSKLAEDTHTYIYAKEVLRYDIEMDAHAWLIFEGDTTLDVMAAIICHDASMKAIQTIYASSGLSKKIELPVGTKYMKLALRIKGSGTANVNRIKINRSQIDCQNLFLSKSNTLVLTNIYPAYGDLYRNAFVHQRVKEYKKRGLNVDVFCFNEVNKAGYREFEGIDVVTGFTDKLEMVLASGKIDTVCVHFLDRNMWNVLSKFKDHLRIIVWCHGSEIQPWWRREFNYNTEEELAQAKILSQDRVQFWTDAFKNIGGYNIHFVFVSKYFRNEIFEDYKIELTEQQYSIIHNYINTELFNYVPKSVEARKHILSIRPFGSRKYANDLTVECIKKLSEKAYFKDLNFHIIGRGDLFKPLTEELDQFENVTIENKFLHQDDIARLHKENGIFIVPTRMDAQGVSRDEAMSSGLVPVTNAVAAIPEFVDETCGILAPEEDYLQMAEGIEDLYHNPEKFLEMSEMAAMRVRSQCSFEYTINSELKLIKREIK